MACEVSARLATDADIAKAWNNLCGREAISPDDKEAIAKIREVIYKHHPAARPVTT